MPGLIRLLIVEDNANDAELTVRELERAGLNFEWERVTGESDYLAKLNSGFDLILSDYYMPQFSGLRALELLKTQSAVEIPFILISGTVGEDVAVDAMRMGASDYLLKDRLARLGGAVKRALAQKQLADEHKTAVNELRWKTALLEAQMDSALDGILVADVHGIIILKNQRLSDIWKCPPEIAASELIAERFQYAANQTKNPPEFVEKLNFLSAHPNELSRDEIELLDGRCLEQYSSPVRDKAGKYFGRIWAFRDITERKRLEQQVLRSQRMDSIGTLAGGIAHDLNNVLAPIMMSLAVLKLQATDKLSRETLEIISASAQHGADLVKQVLSFAKGVEGQRVEVQIKPLIRDVEKIANETFLKNIQVRTIIPKAIWTVIGDATQLRQVLLNLCVNARDAMPYGGILTLSTENMHADEHYAGLHPEARPGPYVLIQVEDNGTGISVDIIEKIFDPFFTTKEIGKSTGLGLSTTQAIVKSHGGFIQVHSEPEKGTKFKVYLPAQTESFIEIPPDTLETLPRGNGELILVVDDEESVRLITKKTLETFGYRVILADDGVEAVSIFSSRHAEIAVVLTDMMMPVMDGPAAIQVLRRIKPDVRIIGASGLSNQQKPMSPASLGVKHFLPKPYPADAMLKILKELLSNEN
jgi:signal transduction histidine kinase/DNA-binding response OmpR family regulator